MISPRITIGNNHGSARKLAARQRQESDARLRTTAQPAQRRFHSAPPLQPRQHNGTVRIRIYCGHLVGQSNKNPNPTPGQSA